MEGLTDGAGVDRSSPAQTEQRLIIRGAACERGQALVQIPHEQRFELGAEWHETALVELRVANEEQPSFEIDVLNAQPARFSHAQSQSIQNGEEREVGTASFHGSALARQGLGKREQPLGCS